MKEKSSTKPATVFREGSLTWREVAAVADGADLRLSENARAGVAAAETLVRSIVDRGLRAYGISTGIGALCDVLVDREQQETLSRNIIMSHATGLGQALAPDEVRAVMAAAVNNFAHGFSGIRLSTVDTLLALLNANLLPVVPSRGSVGYMSHMAHVALAVIGHGRVMVDGRAVTGGEALSLLKREPLRLAAKEGLCLVAGTPCVTGLGAVALGRIERLLSWADAISAMSFENLKGSLEAIDGIALGLRKSDGLQAVGHAMRGYLRGSRILQDPVHRKTQDCLTLRAIPQVHGAARDCFSHVASVIDCELASVTDNPVVSGTPDRPEVRSQAHGVGASAGLALDSLAIAVAEVGAMSERRLDRLLNPLVSGLPAFLASNSGAESGLMIAQYAAVSLVAENRRLAAPAALDGGVTSALQEDHLAHATPAATKLLAIVENVQRILAVEYLAASQAYAFQAHAPASGLAPVYRHLRASLPLYRDDRPLAEDMEKAWRLVRDGDVTRISGLTSFS